MGYSIISERTENIKNMLITNPNDNNIQHIQEASDIAQTIKELNDDSIDATGYSKMDMKSRLNDVEISAILCIDTTIQMEFFPDILKFLTLKKERISPSKDGKGRQEVVEIAKGISQQQSGHSIMDGIVNAFKGGQK